MGRRVRVDEAGEFGAAVDVQLAIDAIQMIGDRRRRDADLLRRLFERQALRDAVDDLAFACGQTVERSEEHTSELQSLMRISYAVFCLKKKKMIKKHCNKHKHTH